MLLQLTISDFAIISHLEIEFNKGLNILSGETGAGKSIIINAVNLILGGRASADLIRTGADEARVEAFFNLSENISFKEILDGMGIPFDGELLIKRTISRSNRNKITINGSMSTLQMLAVIGAKMISISGQHEHQHLLKPDNHVYLLDDFGGLTDERMELADCYSRYESLKDDRRKIEKSIRESREKQDLAAFQITEIESAGIFEGEDTLLEEESGRLRYAEQLRSLVSESYYTLYEKENSVISEISSCEKVLEKGKGMDRGLNSILTALVSARTEIQEASLALRDLRNALNSDPARLEQLDDRLQQLKRLKKKYGPTLEDVMAFKDRLSGLMEDIDQKGYDLEKTNKMLREIEAEIVSRARELSEKRKGCALKLEKDTEAELEYLDMGGTRFQVRFDSHDNQASEEELIKSIGADGYDNVEFMLSPNVGEDLRPLTKIASGGELSRIMLALKTILAKRTSVETVVFDEVDSGISGATAEVVGEKLQSLAEYHQILCITHLPQIASKGGSHFLVKKKVDDSRTQTVISQLDQEGRVNEIARLLGGKVISDQAIAHAREVLSS
jgi:DNA repair protein RecN (Recombination protein N)